MLENLYLPLGAWQLSRTERFFFFWQANEIGGDMNQSDILESVMKYVNIREIHMTQWTNIFPMTDAGYKITVE